MLLIGGVIFYFSKRDIESRYDFLKNVIYGVYGGLIATVLWELKGTKVDIYFLILKIPMTLSIIGIFILLGFLYIYLLNKLFFSIRGSNLINSSTQTKEIISPDKNSLGSPVNTFVAQTIKEIENGLPENYDLTSNIDFELSVANQQAGNGKIDLRVLGLGGETSTQNVQKVRFSVGDPKKSEQQVKKFVNIIKEMAKEESKKR